MMHEESHPLAGATVRLNDSTTDLHRSLVVAGKEYYIQDWWDKLTGGSWMFADENPAAMCYAMRTGMGGTVPTDNEVVYGKIGSLGHLVHVSELGEIVR